MAEPTARDDYRLMDEATRFRWLADMDPADALAQTIDDVRFYARYHRSAKHGS